MVLICGEAGQVMQMFFVQLPVILWTWMRYVIK